jgi:hypothetical protein
MAVGYVSATVMLSCTGVGGDAYSEGSAVGYADG